MVKMGQKRTTIRKPMKKKMPKDYLLDNLWSAVVRMSFDNKCVVCGQSKGQIDAHHWVGRRYRTTRWLIENGVALCHNCHQDMSDLPGFKKDVEKKHIGTDKLEQLELMAIRGIGNKVDKEAIKVNLKQKIKELNGQ